MAWWFKGNKIKQFPKVVEISPEISSIEINREKYLSYKDVINFLNRKEINEGLSQEIRLDLDRATFFTKVEQRGEINEFICPDHRSHPNAHGRTSS